MSMIRRSTRIQAKHKELASADSLSDSAHPSKRRRTARNPDHEQDSSAHHRTRKIKKGTGALSGVLQHMPLDILYEVFAYLTPLDLLALSRSTRDLRIVLLNRSARVVWVDSLRALQISGKLGEPFLPPCPSDLPEPAYASLMLELGCSLCGEQASRSTLLMAIRQRCCFLCFGMKQNFVPHKSLLTSLGTKYAAIVEEFLAPVTPPERSEFSRVHKGTFYQAKEVKTVTSFVKAHYGDKVAMSEFAASRRVVLAVHQEYVDSARLYEEWVFDAANAIRDARSSELQHVRETRREAILARVSAAGYDDLAVLLRPKWSWTMEEDAPRKRTRELFFDKTTFVTATRPLTDRVWEAHKDEVLDDILTIWHAVPVQRRLQRLLELYKAHPARDTSSIFERYRDELSQPAEIYAHYSKVRQVIHAPTPARLDAPDPALTGADDVFGAALDDFFSRVSQELFLGRRLKTIARMLPPFNAVDAPRAGPMTGLRKDMPELQKSALRHLCTVDRARLALAATMFRCSRCATSFSAADAVMHQCFTRNTDQRDARYYLWENTLHMLPWNADSVLEFDEDATDVAAGLIAVTGRNPLTATLEDMKKYARFRCLHSKCKKMGFTHFLFAAAVQHAIMLPHHTEKLVALAGLQTT